MFVFFMFSPELDKDMKKYWSLDEDEAASTYSPMLFIGFPSAKDPSWESRYPGNSSFPSSNSKNESQHHKTYLHT